MSQFEALWAIGFQANNGNFGAGVLVFETGRIFGGDSSYYYVGSYETKDDTIRGQAKVTHYFGHKNNVFGPVDQFMLNFSGTINGDRLTVDATVDGAPAMKLQINGKRLEGLP